MDKKFNMRKERTERIIYEGFVKVLKHKSFTQITINDISKAALVHRNTFYHHFNDKFDLLRRYTRNILTKLVKSKTFANFANEPFKTVSISYQNNVQGIFEIQSDDDLFIQIIWHEFLRTMIEMNNSDKNFIAIGCFSAIIDWNEINGQPYSPIKDYEALDKIYKERHFPTLNK